MKSFILAIIIAVVTPHVNAIIIRHDVNDAIYLDHKKSMPALITFTTSHEGKDYVVGSGTYLGNGWVLTAAHVANFFEDGDTAQINSERLTIKKTILHDKWKDRQVGFDIALVRIAEPIKEIASVSLFTYDVKRGDVITITGRGDTGNGLVGMKPSDLKTRVAQNKVDKVEGQWISFTFDFPEKMALADEGMCGGGDSGSPAYIKQNDTFHIVGLSSWQDTEATNWKQGFYGAKDYYTNINFYKDWILKHLPTKKLK
jgi:secreted trypsin-like serine protease